jgi:hypothetical protein
MLGVATRVELSFGSPTTLALQWRLPGRYETVVPCAALTPAALPVDPVLP